MNEEPASHAAPKAKAPTPTAFAKGVVCGSLGKIMADGECGCPPGMIEHAGGVCQLATPAPSCESGLREGKCYLFKMGRGLFGPGMPGQYDIVQEGRKFAKFKFCKTEACSGRSTINPDDEFRIYDVHGDGLTAHSSGLWFAWSPGSSLGMTATWGKASKLSITRWIDGKYCLSRVYDTFVNQQCIPLRVVEVPCDIRAAENNCISSNSCDGCNSACSMMDDEELTLEKPFEQPDAGELPCCWEGVDEDSTTEGPFYQFQMYLAMILRIAILVAVLWMIAKLFRWSRVVTSRLSSMIWTI
ncbi:hypothetical protein J3F83DRAFT_715551 [Trichoderma novae-zelandiae]